MQNQISFSTTDHPVYKVAELEIVYRRKCKIHEMPVITKSEHAYRIFIDSWNMNKIDIQEHMKVMLLDRSNRVLGIHELATGGISGVVIDAKLIFGLALKAGASGIVLAHNHPSGHLVASAEDIRITKMIAKAGQLLSLPLHDHLIVTSEGYYSMADEGIFPI